MRHSTTILFCIGVFILPNTSYSKTNPIAVAEHFTQALVTVKGQMLDASLPRSTSAARISGTNKIAILERNRILTSERSGAGVIIDPNGTIVTNTHIIYRSQRVIVFLENGAELPAKIIYVSPQYDFSLIKIEHNAPLIAINWAPEDEPRLGEDVMTIGHSSLLDKTLSGGRIVRLGTRTTDNGTEAELIQININHYKGDSGGPVFNKDGYFLGLISAKRLLKDKAVLAIPAGKIHFAYFNLAGAQENK